MYVQSLECSWIENPFLVSSFLLKNEKMVTKILVAGIKIATIDTSLGIDFDAEEKTKKVKKTVKPQSNKPTSKSKDAAPVKAKKKSSAKTNSSPVTKISKEESRARGIYKEGTEIIRNMMEDVRLGKQVEVEAVDPVAEKIVQSIFRNPHALTGISRIKTKDNYTFMHCVSVTGLMVMFAKFMEFDKKTIHEVAIGSLVHDVGKIMVPDKVLNKPGKLNDAEFKVMKDHVTFSKDILDGNPGISQIALDVALLHHERMDGTGYPLGLKGDEISLVGQMSAIVDVYDALTSVRVYKHAWEPTQALKKMIEWCPGHFSTELVQKFIQCLGIYPVGSLVQLNTGKVAIVLEQNKEILRPKVRVIYHGIKKCYIEVVDIDLSKELDEKISTVISPKDFEIELTDFL